MRREKREGERHRGRWRKRRKKRWKRREESEREGKGKGKGGGKGDGESVEERRTSKKGGEEVVTKWICPFSSPIRRSSLKLIVFSTLKAT